MWKKSARQPVIFMSCHPSSSSNNKKINPKNGKHLTIALAGNANVGKSVIFNQLTGSNQIIGNRSGKNPLNGPITVKIGSTTRVLSRAVVSIIQVKRTK
jgi:septin family protein